MSDRIEIQVQDNSGNWRTISITVNNSQTISIRMKEAKAIYLNFKVRAIDANGHLVDMLQ